MNFETEDGKLVRRVPVAVAYCHDCYERIGPSLADNVGHTVSDEHLKHKVETYGWTETEIVQCTDCDNDATHGEERATAPEEITMVPYCDNCGRQS